MRDTVVGLFRTRSEAEFALGKLKDAGFGPDQAVLVGPRRGRRGHYGLKLLAGIMIGTVVGLIAGALAAGVVPGMQPIFHGAVIATFALAAVAGATTGGIAGALFSMAAAGDRALYYEQEVESGRFLVSVTGARLDVAQAMLEDAGALEASPVEAPLERRRRPRPESG